MTTFYNSASTEQSVLLACLFFSLVLSLFCFIVSITRSRKRWITVLNAGIYLALFALLSVLTESFSKIREGREYRTLLPLPMWSLWCITGTIGVFLIFGAIALFRQKNRGLGRNSIKQAFDTLPSAVCYFAPSGIVKLCNFQMHRLFRTLAQSDLQTFNELQQALKECDGKSGVIKLSDERQTYLFPDGTVWRYAQTEVTAPSIGKYTETIFFDVTKLYEKNLQLKAQTKQLKKISLELKFLSDNVLTLTKEKEVLAAKTKLHDQMGAGMIAVRRMLQQKQTTKDIVEAIRLFRKAVNMMKIDNENPLERSELAEFMHDADAIGVKIILTGEMPEQTEVYNAFIVAMRECLTNGVCHAGATELQIDIRQDDSSLSMRITNNGTVPKGEIVPKGGLKNMEHYIINLQGTVKIQSLPVFALTVTVPFAKEGM